AAAGAGLPGAARRPARPVLGAARAGEEARGATGERPVARGEPVDAARQSARAVGELAQATAQAVESAAQPARACRRLRGLARCLVERGRESRVAVADRLAGDRVAAAEGAGDGGDRLVRAPVCRVGL